MSSVGDDCTRVGDDAFRKEGLRLLEDLAFDVSVLGVGDDAFRKERLRLSRSFVLADKAADIPLEMTPSGRKD